MPEDMMDFFYLDNIEDCYFILAEGLNKKAVIQDINDQMELLIDKHNYFEFYVLSQGEIGRTLLKPTIQMNAWVKFFRTEEKYQEFVKNYDPFKK